MEQISADVRSIFRADGNLLPTQSDLLTEDPATFLISHQVLVSGIDSVAALKEHLKPVPEIAGLADELLVEMEKQGLISVDGDEISVKSRDINLGGDAKNLKRFLPRLLEIASKRVLMNAQEEGFERKKEGLHYFVLPGDEESANEARAAYREFRARMQAIKTKAIKEGRKGDSIRFVSVANASLVAEDFV